MRDQDITSASERLWASVDKSADCWIRCGYNRGQGYTLLRVNGKDVRAHRVAWELATGETLTPNDVIGHTCDIKPCVRNDEAGIYVVRGVEYPRMGHLWKAVGNAANTFDKMDKGRYRCLSGDDHPNRLHPERLRRGDLHHARLTPEKMARGERHWSRTKPDRVARGERSGAATHPEAILRGEKHGRAKLTADMVREIRAIHAQGAVTLATLSRRYGVALQNIKYIVDRKTWRHID